MPNIPKYTLYIIGITNPHEHEICDYALNYGLRSSVGGAQSGFAGLLVRLAARDPRLVSKMECCEGSSERSNRVRRQYSAKKR